MDVFLHLDSYGLQFGNGGCLALTLLGNELTRMGHTVHVFDQRDTLTPQHFDWMSLSARLFDIVPYATVCKPSDSLIITSWLRNWLSDLQQRPALWPRLRFWCHDELLRTDSHTAREFVNAHIGPVAVTNPHLDMVYEEAGITPRWHIPLWVRSEFQPNADQRVPGRVGYQPDNGQALDLADGVPCVGTQRDVWETMQTCDVFVWWNAPKNLMFDGEGFGLTLYEAMACGCVPVARAHQGNMHLAAGPMELLITRDWDTAKAFVDGLRSHDEWREAVRAHAQHTITHNYRWDGTRARAITQWLNVEDIA